MKIFLKIKINIHILLIIANPVQKENLFQKNKFNVIKDNSGLNHDENPKIKINKKRGRKASKIEKQNLELKEFSLKKLKNLNNIENPPIINNENMLEMEKIIQEKNDEIKKLEEKINQLSIKNGDKEVSADFEENKYKMKIMEDKLNKANEQ